MAASIKVTLELDDRGYLTGIQTAKAETAALGTAAKTAGAGAATGFAGMAVAVRGAQAAVMGLMSALAPLLAISTAVEAFRSAFAFGDEISDLSAATGIAAEKIINLQQALTLAGGRGEDASKMLTKLFNNLESARSGSEQAANKLGELGFTLADIENMSPEQALQKTIQSLASMTDPIQRNALAFELLGKSAANIQWDQVAAGTQSVTEEQQRAANATKILGDAADSVAAVFGRLKLLLAEFIAPIVQVMGTFEKFTGIITIVKGVMTVLGAVISGILVVFNTLAGEVEKGASALVAFYESSKLALSGDFSGAKKVWTDYARHVDDVTKQVRENNRTLLGMGQAPAPAAAPAAGNAAGTQSAIRGASELRNKINQQTEAIRANAESFAAANRSVRDRIQVETEMIGVSEQARRVRNEQIAIEDRARTAIERLNGEYAKLGTGIADREKRAAIQETIAAIRAQAAADTAAVAETLRNNQTAQRAYQERVDAIQQTFGGEAMRRGIDLEIRQLTVFTEAERRILQEESKIQEEYYAAVLEAQKKYLNDKEALDAAIVQAERNRQGAMAQLQQTRGSLEALTAETNRIQEARRALDAVQGPQRAVRDLQAQVAVMRGATEEERAILQLRMDSVREYQDGVAALNREFAAVQDREQNAEYQRRLQALQRTREQQTAEINGSVEAIKQAFADMRFEDYFTKAKDALTEFVMTGKLSFKDLARSMLQSFARRMIDEMFSPLRGALQTVFSGISTGISGFIGSVIGSLFGGGRAAGGPVVPGKIYRVGERGPEWFTTNQPGNIIPNMPAAQAQPTQITYNIQAVDAPSFRALIARDPEFIYAVTERGRSSIPGGRR